MDNQKVVMVTGASRGIGKSIATRLAKEGYALAICGTRLETIEPVAQALAEQYQANVIARAVDVSDAKAAKAFVTETVKHFGRLDVLVNNAGITCDGLAMRMKEDDWNRVLNTNLNSVFYLSQAVLRPMMKAKSGSIINVSSVVASMGNPGQLNYCASKGGVEAMTRSLAREVGSRAIRVNAVAPGFIATDMTEQLGDEAKQNLASQIPLGKLGSPEDIANTVAFLASEQSAYITGQILHVNGGMYM